MVPLRFMMIYRSTRLYQIFEKYYKEVKTTMMETWHTTYINKLQWTQVSIQVVKINDCLMLLLKEIEEEHDSINNLKGYSNMM